jgi:CubicO group peptidase (beta-lactamase class C family)
MRHTPIVLAVLLVIATISPVGGAQVETPVTATETSPVTSPLATPQTGARTDLTGVAPLPLTGDRLVAFETYVVDAMNRLGVPGASVAVVQGGQITYAQGFGVKELSGAEPVTADTLMMVGSVTKSLTSTMAATLVDDGSLSWDTPVIDLLPGFAVADPQLTARLTVADAFCACTGLPPRDIELLFNVDTLTPELMVASVAGLPLTAPFGETWQYSNQMYSVGGYAAASAAGDAPDDLYGGYVAAMHERILGPIGMDRSTFALADVLADGDYASGHATDLDGRTGPFSLQFEERYLRLVAPAGALWSSAREMARYLQTQMADGVAPDGTRVVSVENLGQTWAPRVAIAAPPGLSPALAESSQYYGMGWLVGTYKGQPLINHSGGTGGFISAVAFLPEADLGIVILSNGGPGAVAFYPGVQNRLFELLFDQPSEFDALLGPVMEAQSAQLAQIRDQFRPVDPTAVAPWLGRYANPTLGEVTLSLRDGELILDTGGARSELRAVADEAGQVVAYLLIDPPFAGPTPVTLRQGDGGPEVVAMVDGDPTATHVFTLLGPDAGATPAS